MPFVEMAAVMQGGCSSYKGLYVNPVLPTLIIYTKYTYTDSICTCLQYIQFVQLYILMSVLERKMYFSSINKDVTVP